MAEENEKIELTNEYFANLAETDWLLQGKPILDALLSEQGDSSAEVKELMTLMSPIFRLMFERGWAIGSRTILRARKEYLKSQDK